MDMYKKSILLFGIQSGFGIAHKLFDIGRFENLLNDGKCYLIKTILSHYFIWKFNNWNAQDFTRTTFPVADLCKKHFPHASCFILICMIHHMDFAAKMPKWHGKTPNQKNVTVDTQK
ncbi:hypothetical protein ACJX0J_038627 [Zea mays]